MDTERRREIPQSNLSFGSNEGLWSCEEATLPDTPPCCPLGVITFQVSETTDAINLLNTVFSTMRLSKHFQSLEIEEKLEKKKTLEHTHTLSFFLKISLF